MLVGATCTTRPRQIETGRSQAILVVPMLATLVAVPVLVISAFGQLPAAVVSLATFTLLLAACDYAQGYHFSRPLPGGASTAWTHARVVGAAAQAAVSSA